MSTLAVVPAAEDIQQEVLAGTRVVFGLQRALDFVLVLIPKAPIARARRPRCRGRRTEHGIATEAWSPPAQGAVLGDDAIRRIAETHGVTSAQVVLRRHLQNGTIVIPKPVTPDRIRQNLDVFGFPLTDADMTALAGLDRDLRTGPDPDTFN